eukprot:gene12133-14059_t
MEKKNSAAEYFIRDPFVFDSWRVSDPFRDELFPYEDSVFPDSTDRTKPYAPLLTSDIIETEHDFKMLADLPGVRIEDIDVSIEGNLLVIKAERKYTHQTNTDKYHSLERSYGTVQRSIRFPKSADAANAITRYKDGVLSVTFPKLGRLTPASTKLKIHRE